MSGCGPSEHGVGHGVEQRVDALDDVGIGVLVVDTEAQCDEIEAAVPTVGAVPVAKARSVGEQEQSWGGDVAPVGELVSLQIAERERLVEQAVIEAIELCARQELMDQGEAVADLDGEFSGRCGIACAAQHGDHRERASLEVSHRGVRPPGQHRAVPVRPVHVDRTDLTTRTWPVDGQAQPGMGVDRCDQFPRVEPLRSRPR